MNDFYKMPDTCQIKQMPQILEEYVGKKTDGVFIEVGANDGETYGMTAGLADMGWRGIYVEPVPYLAHQCSNRHKKNRVTVVECAVGDHNGIVPIHVSGSGNGAFSTSVTEFVEQNLEHFTGEIVRAPLLTMDELLNQVELGKSIDMLVIDTEGTEVGVLKGFTSLKVLRPTIIAIEHNSNLDTVKGIEEYLYPEYDLIYIDGINFVFLYNPDGLPRRPLIAIMEEMRRVYEEVSNGRNNNDPESTVNLS